MASPVAIVLLVILGALMVWGIIERKKVEKWLTEKWDELFGDSPAPAPAPAPVPAPAPTPSPASNRVEITNDGIQFPQQDKTEGYLSEGIPCKRLQALEESEFTDTTNGYMGFDTYTDYTADINSRNDNMFGDDGYCTKMELDENQRAIAYFYSAEEGARTTGAFNDGRCTYTDQDKPYACVYKEVKDDDGYITGFVNNEGKRLEVAFYNDYKDGKIKTWLDDKGFGTTKDFILNSDNKLEISINDPNNATGGGNGSILILPGNNYPVKFSLLGTAIAMVNQEVPMPENGVYMKFTTLTDDEMRANMEAELSETANLESIDESQTGQT